MCKVGLLYQFVFELKLIWIVLFQVFIKVLYLYDMLCNIGINNILFLVSDLDMYQNFENFEF